MKRFLYIFLFTNLYAIFLNGQSMLTYRDVYDFNINDEFQSHALSVPPNANRVKIIGKHLSINNDTVFYVRSFNNYSSTVSYTPTPHLIYSHSAGIDSVNYTNLDTLINAPFRNMPNDSCDSSKDTLYNSTQFCGAQVYEHTSCTACCFEGYSYDYIYGKGLGEVNFEFSYPANYVDNHSVLFYYKKGSLVCGTPDTTAMTVSVTAFDSKQELLLYPNPAINTLNVTNIIRQTTIRLYDILGNLIFEIKITRDSTLDIAALTDGMYMLIAEDYISKNCFKVVVAKE